MLDDVSVACPYGGEDFDTWVDCPVCCRPIEFQAEVDGAGDLIRLTTPRDDD